MRSDAALPFASAPWPRCRTLRRGGHADDRIRRRRAGIGEAEHRELRCPNSRQLKGIGCKHLAPWSARRGWPPGSGDDHPRSPQPTDAPAGQSLSDILRTNSVSRTGASGRRPAGRLAGGGPGGGGDRGRRHVRRGPGEAGRNGSNRGRSRAMPMNCEGARRQEEQGTTGGRSNRVERLQAEIAKGNATDQGVVSTRNTGANGSRQQRGELEQGDPDGKGCADQRAGQELLAARVRESRSASTVETKFGRWLIDTHGRPGPSSSQVASDDARGSASMDAGARWSTKHPDPSGRGNGRQGPETGGREARGGKGPKGGGGGDGGDGSHGSGSGDSHGSGSGGSHGSGSGSGGSQGGSDPGHASGGGGSTTAGTTADAGSAPVPAKSVEDFSRRAEALRQHTTDPKFETAEAKKQERSSKAKGRRWRISCARAPSSRKSGEAMPGSSSRTSAASSDRCGPARRSRWCSPCRSRTPTRC